MSFRSIATLLVLLATLTASKADQPTVAMLPTRVAFEHWKYLNEAESAVELVAATLATRMDDVQWVDRQATDDRVEELTLSLAQRRLLSTGKGVATDLVVLPIATRDDVSTWQIRLDVIDPVRADVLASATCMIHPARPDLDAAVTAATDAIRAGLEQQEAQRNDLAVAPLFFTNTTGTERIDDFGDRLMQTLAAAERPDVRLLTFPSVPEGAGEQRLALAGLAGDPDRWQEVADRWIWGEYREVDWEGVPFDQVTIEVTATVWDGVGVPTRLVRVGTVGDREALAKEVADAVLALATKPAGVARQEANEEMAERLLGQAMVMQRQSIGGAYQATEAWLARFRHEVRLLELATFFAPEDPKPALEFLRARYRDDVSIAFGRSSGLITRPMGEPERLYFLRRAIAWGEFVERFGFGFSWAGLRQEGWADNRTGLNYVSGEYLHTAEELRRQLPGGRPRGMREGQDFGWPLTPAQAKALATTWDEELERRRRHVADYVAASLDDQSLAEDRDRRLQMWQHVSEIKDVEPTVAQDAVERLIELASAKEKQSISDFRRRMIESIGDEAWAERQLALLPEPIDRTGREARRKRTPRKPSTLPTLAKLDPKPASDIQLPERAGEVLKILVHGHDWLVLHNANRGNTTATNSRGSRRLDLPNVVDVTQHGKTAWLVDASKGLRRLDLSTSQLTAIGRQAGLPTSTLGAVTVDAAGTPSVVSGVMVTPTVATLDPFSGQWSARGVDSFPPRSETQNPKVLAVGDETILVAGHRFGVDPFISRLDRETGEWTNLRSLLIAHLDGLNLDFKTVQFGKDRFGLYDALRLSDGSFAMIHSLGVTQLSADGEIVGTWAFDLDRSMTEHRDSLLSPDGSTLWIAAKVKRGSGECLVEVRLDEPSSPPLLFDLPRNVSPTALAWREGELLLGTGSGSLPPVLSVPLNDESLTR